MKRLIEEVVNEHQAVKKQKVVVSKVSNVSDPDANGWAKIEKKKKKRGSKAGMGPGKQNVRRSSRATGFITTFKPIRPVCFNREPPSWRPWLLSLKPIFSVHLPHPSRNLNVKPFRFHIQGLCIRLMTSSSAITRLA